MASLGCFYPSTIAFLLLSSFPASLLADSVDCSSQLTLIAPCLPYVQPNNQQPPNKDCCDGVHTFVAKDPSCLCQLVAGGSSGTGIVINATRAEQLPKLCSVKVPITASNCTVAPSTGTTPPKGTTPSGSTPAAPNKASPKSSDGYRTTSPCVWSALSLGILFCSLISILA